MPELDINALSHTVLWATFALTFVFGALLQRTHFCTMGAVSDAINIGDWSRVRMWVLAIGVAMIGTGVLSWLGLIDTSKTLYTANKLLWLSSLVGGLLFGFGMVLGSGCGSKTLVRIGGGNLKSVVVFVFLGLSAYMTLKGVFGVVRVATVDNVAMMLPTPQDLPSVLGHALSVDVRTLRLALALVIGGALSLWALLGRDFRTVDNLLGGIGVGLIIVAMWYVSGHLGYVQEDPNTLQEAFVATNSVIAENCQNVAVMYRGQIIESASVEQLFVAAEHPYTRGLIASIPDAQTDVDMLNAIPGRVPTIDDKIDGCAFHPRCSFTQDICRTDAPQISGPLWMQRGSVIFRGSNTIT